LPEYEIEDDRQEELIERKEQLRISQFKSFSLFDLNDDIPIGIVVGFFYFIYFKFIF
jgi:hypothetical protein